MSIYDANFILIYCCIVAFILGACMGSFLNCAAIRIGGEKCGRVPNFIAIVTKDGIDRLGEDQ